VRESLLCMRNCDSASLKSTEPCMKAKTHARLDRDGRAPPRRRLSAAEIRTIRGARVPVQCISGRQDLCAGRFWVARFARALGCPHILLGARRRGLPADAALRAPPPGRRHAWLHAQ